MTNPPPTLKIGTGVILIVTAGISSTILSTSVDMSKYELGALVNVFWPGVLTVISIVVFLISCWITKNRYARIMVIVILSAYLLYVGLALHMEKDYWPLVMW